MARQVSLIDRYNREWIGLRDGLRNAKRLYTMLMTLITLFVLFVATWIALFLAKQISIPITALLEAASQVRKGNLKHRVEVRAVDELALAGARLQPDDAGAGSEQPRARPPPPLHRGHPRKHPHRRHFHRRRRLHPARQPRAVQDLSRPPQVDKATRLEDLFSREDTAEIKYLMKRARRTGSASRQFELRTENRKLHLAVTVSALEEKLTSGFVMVLEDTSELLRAQKAAAWHEVARRVAHEIKNPLTPIALSAERIARQMDRLDLAARRAASCASAPQPFRNRWNRSRRWWTNSRSSRASPRRSRCAAT